MAVFRVERNSGYTVMSNHHLRNKELTLKAKGLLSQMLSLPEDWDYTLAGLSHINRESIDAIRTAVWELEKAGYILRRQGRDEKGKMTAIEYTIYEQPQPMLENPIPGNSGVVGVQGKLSDIKTRYRSEEYQLETGNDTDMLILQQTFPNMQQIGRNQLVFCEVDYTVFDILRFIADRHIALLKLERAEPTLESLFMEVVEK